MKIDQSIGETLAEIACSECFKSGLNHKAFRYKVKINKSKTTIVKQPELEQKLEIENQNLMNIGCFNQSSFNTSKRYLSYFNEKECLQSIIIREIVKV